MQEAIAFKRRAVLKDLRLQQIRGQFELRRADLPDLKQALDSGASPSAVVEALIVYSPTRPEYPLYAQMVFFLLKHQTHLFKPLLEIALTLYEYFPSNQLLSALAQNPGIHSLQFSADTCCRLAAVCSRGRFYSGLLKKVARQLDESASLQVIRQLKQHQGREQIWEVLPALAYKFKQLTLLMREWPALVRKVVIGLTGLPIPQKLAILLFLEQTFELDHEAWLEALLKAGICEVLCLLLAMGNEQLGQPAGKTLYILLQYGRDFSEDGTEYARTVARSGCCEKWRESNPWAQRIAEQFLE